MVTFRYVTSVPGVVHVVRQVDERFADHLRHYTLCGHAIYYGWKEGNETVTGVAVTCITCRRKVKALLSRQAEA